MYRYLLIGLAIVLALFLYISFSPRYSLVLSYVDLCFADERNVGAKYYFIDIHSASLRDSDVSFLSRHEIEGFLSRHYRTDTRIYVDNTLTVDSNYFERAPSLVESLLGTGKGIYNIVHYRNKKYLISDNISRCTKE